MIRHSNFFTWLLLGKRTGSYHLHHVFSTVAMGHHKFHFIYGEDLIPDFIPAVSISFLANFISFTHGIYFIVPQHLFHW